MPYIQATTRAGDTVILEQYQAPRWNCKGGVRLPASEPICEAQERANANREKREFIIKVNANFKEGDYHLVLDYTNSDRPQEIEAAKDDREHFMRRLRYIYKRAGVVLKYIIITEWGKKRGGLHHHLIINRDRGIDEDLIRRAWKKGRVHFNPLDDKGDYTQLASYLVKNRVNWRKYGGSGRQWTCSRNLARPKTEKKIVKRDIYYDKPKPRPGYYISEYSESGFTKEGYPYRFYVFVKDKRVRDP